MLSTIYQRQSDTPRSDQALSRVALAGLLSPARLSQLRSLSGQILKEVLIAQWRNGGVADGAPATNFVPVGKPASSAVFKGGK